MSSKLEQLSQHRGRLMGDLVEGSVLRGLERMELRELQKQERRQDSVVLRAFRRMMR